MPYGHGRRNSVIEKFAYGRNNTLSRRLIDRTNSHTCPKDLQPVRFAPTCSELRLPLFTVLFVDADVFRKSSNFPSFLPDTTVQKKFDLHSPSNMDGHRPSSPGLLMVGLQTANTEFSRSTYISSEASSSGKSTKNLSSSLASSSTLSCCFTSGNSSVSICDNTNEVSSGFMVNDFPKVDKKVKRNSRKKSKKKGKQYKRVASRTGSIESSVQCNGNIYRASASETSTPSSVYSSEKNLSDNNLSDEATPHRLLGTDIILNKDDCENNNEFVDCQNLSSCTSNSAEMVDTETIPSPETFAGDDSGRDTTISVNSSCTTDDAAVFPLTTDGSAREGHCKENNIHDGNPLNIPINKTLECWNSDIDENSSDDTAMQLPVKEEIGPSSSEGEIVSPCREIAHGTLTDTTASLCDLDAEISKDCYRNSTDLSNDVLDAYSSTERADCSSQAGSSNGFHVVVSGKRGRRSRRTIDNSGLSGDNRSSNANIHNHGGKDNYCSIWQKVQKFEKGCSKPNDSFSSPHREVSTKDNKMKTKGNKFIEPKQKQSGITYKYPCPDANSTIEATQVVPRGSKTGKTLFKSAVGNSVNDVKSKSNTFVKHAKHNHWSGTYTGKTDVPNGQKHHFQPKEGLQNTPVVNINNQNNTEVKSPHNRFLGRSLSKLTDSCMTEIEKETHVRLEDEKESGNACNGVCHSEISCIPTTLNQFAPGHIEAISGNDTKMFFRDTLSHSIGSTEGQEFGKLDFGSHKESNNLNSTKTTMQKWVPVGRRDSTVSDINPLEFLKISVNNKELHNQIYREVVEMDDVVSNSSSSLGKVTEFSYARASASTNNLSCYHHSTEVLDSCAAINCQNSEITDNKTLGFETDLEKIIIAVNDACKLQTAVEDAQLMAGSTVADFEKFLFSASPVIKQSEPGRTCNSCKKEQLIGSLCWHHAYNISLKKIWQWYEEPGCFGLEVKAHEICNSRRLQNGHLEFTAYFVPYLSAVQLFRMSRSSKNCDLNSQVNKTGNSSHSFASLPSLSKLLSKPCNNADVSSPELSSSDKIQDQEELIFEYFESDQPPRRQPLFEKIKELVTWGTLSNGCIFGDPLKLESTKLQDLHPASWYCVAWYPIYRIPDANFRASFLTYHSLGNFVCRSDPECVDDAFSTLISPVVGLQTYNDKGENWFEPRDMSPNVRSSLCISDLIKERLRTLKKTASTMSRAVVAKGGRRSVNRHPDYDFFVSRSW
ncbi:uncharacterized protein LOC121984707 isoform X1 [Zingiber officinale]|uniref:Uncharacterized protein n=2 Tax=Zingiber officinale TaxID=94328 RepID=A0A8J5GHL5_ZINOF|nr:uncharacterized protein LOC121984707 isoform X1 [Zingiber officinale]XP_042393732.1 uncharacterized protein LOC121984707 isoform X1 [Zingiber officinale]XP_042393733.1 uncharacterized protein LOC121984707 isoform X1 [Zingiber officinale]KAG6503764.1 hypothetical protein ZIOFF_036088 [Zingiber officinale]